MGAVVPKLLSQNAFLKEVVDNGPMEMGNSMIAMSIFRAVFCTSDLCVGCPQEVNDVFSCVSKFRTQETQKNNAVMKMIQKTFGPKLTKKQRKALKKAKRRQKIKPKVTVFMSDNEDFKAEVKRIIEDNNKQPDKD